MTDTFPIDSTTRSNNYMRQNMRAFRADPTWLTPKQQRRVMHKIGRAEAATRKRLSELDRGPETAPVIVDDPLAHECPTCSAWTGVKCHTASGAIAKSPHKARLA